MKTITTYGIQLKELSVIDIPENIIKCSDEAVAVFQHAMQGCCEEYVYMLTTNVKGKITGLFEVSHGDLSSTSIHPREVYKRALANNAAAVIISHNHPSGDTTPSDEDICATKRIAEAGDILGIKLLDHIIIGEGGDYMSLSAEGLM